MESDNQSSMNVLVVDDEEGMREGIRRILSKKGFTVDTAESGEKALELLKDKTYDLAFIDLKMPGIDGFKVTEYIHSEVKSNTVVIIVSAIATVEAAMEVTRHGAFDFLVKPFTPQDLIAVTERAVKQRRLIVEREKYLLQLNKERSLSNQILKSMQEGIVVVNVLKQIVLMNPKAEFYLNQKYSDELTVESLFYTKRVKELIYCNLGNPAECKGTRVYRAHVKEDLMLEFRIEPIFVEDNLNGVLVIIHDITEEWKAEQDKNRFVSMVAHELKSPLAAIINYLNIILSGMFDNKPEKIHELLERCKIRGEALLELIQDLLYINKRVAGKVEKDIKRYDLKKILQEQLEFYKPNAEEKGIKIELIADENDEYPVMADKQDLDRIFMNLISNGIKYNRENGRLTVKIKKEKGNIIVDISDTGIGMNENEMKNLFKEFYRVRNEKTAGIVGTGLGLATVKRVLSEYNGRIEVHSKPDVGTTFTVYLAEASVLNKNN